VREIDAGAVTDAVARLCIEANYRLGRDVTAAFEAGMAREEDGTAREVLAQLLENARVAAEGELPMCQDTGLAVVFVELGGDVHVRGALSAAIDEGVRRGYEEGYLRKSVVRDPIDRVNTRDNTPAIIHCDVVPGDRLKITVAPKGVGSENMSRLAMLKPSDGIEGVRRFVVETVRLAGPNPCPPIVVGVGVGGNMEKACLIAKRALIREIGSVNPDPFWAGVERALLEEINALDIGPGGFGGCTTALAVHVEPFATHIGGLPVAVNIGCHAARHAAAVL
jgi:fumarate hydratase subunit alpha